MNKENCAFKLVDEIILDAVRSENNINHRNAVCGEKAEFLNVETDGTHSYYFVLWP